MRKLIIADPDGRSTIIRIASPPVGFARGRPKLRGGKWVTVKGHFDKDGDPLRIYIRDGKVISGKKHKGKSGGSGKAKTIKKSSGVKVDREEMRGRWDKLRDDVEKIPLDDIKTRFRDEIGIADKDTLANLQADLGYSKGRSKKEIEESLLSVLERRKVSAEQIRRI